jgi:hypothetical protein
MLPSVWRMTEVAGEKSQKLAVCDDRMSKDAPLQTDPLQAERVNLVHVINWGLSYRVSLWFWTLC